MRWEDDSVKRDRKGKGDSPCSSISWCRRRALSSSSSSSQPFPRQKRKFRTAVDHYAVTPINQIGYLQQEDRVAAQNLHGTGIMTETALRKSVGSVPAGEDVIARTSLSHILRSEETNTKLVGGFSKKVKENISEGLDRFRIPLFNIHDGRTWKNLQGRNVRGSSRAPLRNPSPEKGVTPLYCNNPYKRLMSDNMYIGNMYLYHIT
ncbi:hypothetical protein K449DRAFT_206553 [Hypoxylon sp. EC38]|nr:hypothetical protein K449DRAFT_206553 [Hypoxylon sp. EC38]